LPNAHLSLINEFYKEMKSFAKIGEFFGGCINTTGLNRFESKTQSQAGNANENNLKKMRGERETEIEREREMISKDE
jgi:hypothetical protein